MIYLDNAATTFPKPECVYKAMDEMNRKGAVNAGRGSYKLARNASELITDTKDKLRQLVNVDVSTAIVFSPSVTIAMNQIINGLKLQDNAVIYISPFEHNAVVRTLHSLSKKKSIKIKEIPINKDLEVDIERLKYEFSKDKPTGVFCTHISNVTGYILPVEDIFSLSKQYHAVNVLDSSQSLGLIAIRAHDINVDIIAFTGHKTLYGPIGIGGFINVSGIALDEYIVGGTGSDSLNLDMPSSNEGKYESASTNIVAVAGLNAALSCLDQELNYKHEFGLTRYLISRLEEVNNIKLYLPSDLNHHVGIVSFSIENYSSEDVGFILDEDFDIAVRTGYHCAPIVHNYLRDFLCLGTVRVGLGQFNTESDIDSLIEAIKDIEG